MKLNFGLNIPSHLSTVKLKSYVNSKNSEYCDYYFDRCGSIRSRIFVAI